MDSNTELAAIEHEMPTTEQLRKFGYWSGHYLIGCNDCKETVHGVGKRAWRCEPCAIGAFQEAALTQQPAEQIANGALGVTQRDRDQAADLGALHFMFTDLQMEKIRQGKMDGTSFVQAFARHAQQARAQALEEAANKAHAAICDYALDDGDKSPGAIAAIAYNTIRALQPHRQGGGE